MICLREKLHNAWKNGSRTELLTAVYICLMLSIFPLIPGIHGYNGLTFAKWLTFIVLSLAYLLSLFIVLLRGDDKLELRLSLPQVLVLVYGALTFISAIASPWGDTVWLGSGRYEGWLTMACYMAVFMAVSLFARVRRIYAYVLAAVLLINDVIALLQLRGLNPFHLYPGGYDYFDGNVLYSGEFLGTLGNVGMMAAFICLSVPVLICCFIRWRKDSKFSRLLLAAALLSVYVLLRSGVAAGVVGLLAVGAILPFLLLRQGKSRLVWLAILLSCAAAAVLYIGGYDGKNTTLRECSAVLHGEVDDSFGSSRILIWRETVKLSGERPLLGGGPDTLKERLDLVFAGEEDKNGNRRRTIVDTAHNDYLNIAVNTGWPSLAVYLAALFASAICWIKRRNNTAALVCGGGMLGYCVQIFFSFSICIVAPLFWICWGLLLSKN